VIRPLILPLCCVAALVLAIVAAGHAFAAAGRTAERRVPVADRDPQQAVGIARLDAWAADRPRIFQQAPMLAGRDLPPVADRLPERPQIIIPAESAGPYGGTWSRFSSGLGESLRVEVEWYLNAGGLVRWTGDGTRMAPDLAESYEVSPDARVFTFHLRRGLRWSDGVPFTSDDVRFWFDHVARDLSLSTNAPTPITDAGGTIETPDPLTVRFVLARPNGLLIEKMGSDIWASDLCATPRHYLERFHPSSRPQAELDAEAKAAGAAGWAERFRNRWSWRNPECPRLWAWVMKTPPPATTVVLERNPYYYKVDPDGRQLPYIDRITMTLADAESIPLKLMRGDAALQERYLRAKDYALLMAHQEHGGYRIRHWLGATVTGIFLNRGSKRPALRALINDGRLGRALSLAVDRAELIALFTGGVGRATQAVPHPSSPYADPAAATDALACDPVEAGRLLDAAGCPRGADGVRRMADGEPLRFQVDTFNADLVEPGQVIVQQWAQIGVQADIRLLARELYYARKGAGDHEALLDTVGGNEVDPLLSARAYSPTDPEAPWAGVFASYFRVGSTGAETPPQDLIDTVGHWRAIEGSVDPAVRKQHFAALLQAQRDRRAVIGLYTSAAPALLVRDDMRNVPQVAVSGWVYRSLGASAPESFALDPSRRGGR
jgi:peptide/nickel transport system substrate-binding protein